MVFQKPNPFPKSIYDNIAYGPRIHGLAQNKLELNEIVETLADAGGRIHTLENTIAFSAHPKKQIIDTTGAGDVFFAAYLFSRIYIFCMRNRVKH